MPFALVTLTQKNRSFKLKIKVVERINQIEHEHFVRSVNIGERKYRMFEIKHDSVTRNDIQFFISTLNI